MLATACGRSDLLRHFRATVEALRSPAKDACALRRGAVNTTRSKYLTQEGVVAFEQVNMDGFKPVEIRNAA